jgi:hypothetical protein
MAGDDRHSLTINISGKANLDIENYISERKFRTGERITKQQFIETAIMRELARVEGRDVDGIPDTPNRRSIAQRRRRGKP